MLTVIRSQGGLLESSKWRALYRAEQVHRRCSEGEADMMLKKQQSNSGQSWLARESATHRAPVRFPWALYALPWPLGPAFLPALSACLFPFQLYSWLLGAKLLVPIWAVNCPHMAGAQKVSLKLKGCPLVFTLGSISPIIIMTCPHKRKLSIWPSMSEIWKQVGSPGECEALCSKLTNEMGWAGNPHAIWPWSLTVGRSLAACPAASPQATAIFMTLPWKKIQSSPKMK